MCQTCTSSPLLSPSQCNMSDTEDDCGAKKYDAVLNDNNYKLLLPVQLPLSYCQ